MIDPAARIHRQMPLLPSVLRASVASLFILSAASVTAGEVETLISHAGERDAQGRLLVAFRFLNDGPVAEQRQLPDRMPATLTVGGRSQTVWLERGDGTATTIEVPPQGFARATYHFQAPTQSGHAGAAVLSIPGWSDQQIALTVAPPADDRQMADAAQGTPPVFEQDGRNRFLDHFSAYEPIYAVYGPGTNTSARVQLSFKYQLLGRGTGDQLPTRWRDGLHLAFTQRMFWDLGARSSPFRNIDYQPELLYLTPGHDVGNGALISGQLAIRHESNGRSGLQSRSVNSIMLAPMVHAPLNEWKLVIGPRFSIPFGNRQDNPDIWDYRGRMELVAQIGTEDGFRLSTNSRLNIGTGKGAMAADISYPLARILGGGPEFYLYGQAFVGYGENLLDYNRKTTRFRAGLALVR